MGSPHVFPARSGILTFASVSKDGFGVFHQNEQQYASHESNPQLTGHFCEIKQTFI